MNPIESARTRLTRSPDAPATIAATSILNVIATAGFLVLPIIVAGAQQTLHMSDREVGVLSALGMAGSMVSAIVAKWWVRSMSWPTAARITLGGLVLSNVLLIAFHQRVPFFALQAVGGFFAGSLYSLTLIILSDGEQPDRNFGFAIAAQVIFQVLGLLAGPTLLRLAGINSLFVVFATLDVGCLLLMGFLPDRGRAVPQAVSYRSLLSGATSLALGGCFFYLLNATCYWTYIGIIGQRVGLADHAIATALAIGVSAGFFGALSASWFGTRIHRNWALGIGALLTLLAAGMLIGTPRIAAFTVSAALYNFAWNYSLAYQYAAVNATDPTGHSVALAPAFHTAGAAAGPAIAALLVTPTDQSIVIWLIYIGTLASLACFLVSTLAERRLHRLSRTGV
jgi:MFS transporter, DHA1 family, inner membrane transport protein